MWTPINHRIHAVISRLHNLPSRGLPPDLRITLRLVWPLWLLPLFFLSQLLTPHPIWMVLIVTVLGLYVLAYWWLRQQGPGLVLTRRQRSAILVAGDRFEEEFTLSNRSRLPLLWAEVEDGSDLAEYTASRVVAAASHGHARWRAGVDCRRRGVYRIGPATIRTGDPFGLAALELKAPHTDSVLIYPRVVQLPRMVMLRGYAGGVDRRRQPLLGVLPASSVRDYQRGDSLRYIHWPKSAHGGGLIVKELELEPTGDVWIVLDLNRAAHRGEDEASTLEYAIVVAASAAAALLDAPEQRAVGLLTVVGGDETSQDRVIEIQPQRGRAQLWRVMAALAPVHGATVGLAQLLQHSRNILGRRRSLILITSQLASGEESATLEWMPEILRLQATGLSVGVLLVIQEDEREAAQATCTLLGRLDIPVDVLSVAAKLPTLITYRRTRTVYRSTPTGGLVAQEVEEEVG